jgi:hypothetical protein
VSIGGGTNNDRIDRAVPQQIPVIRGGAIHAKLRGHLLGCGLVQIGYGGQPRTAHLSGDIPGVDAADPAGPDNGEVQ